jgi:Asp-tRNA(Asn)/Glu-tRNA(Gln) amidotransferase B subunit
MMQLVEIAEKTVRFHLSQDKTNQFIVTTVSKTTNQQEMTVAEADLADAAVADMVETVVVEDLEETEMADAVPEDMAETAAAVEDLEETDLQEKCTQLHVQSVEQNVKFHSNQMEKNQFIVTTVSKSVNQQETTVDAEDISHF